MESVIGALLAELEKTEQHARDLKKMVNDARGMKGEPPLFTDIEGGSTSVSGRISIDHDTFYGKSTTTAVRDYLRMKGKAAAAEEIFEALGKGGFEWPKEWKEKMRLRNLAISLGSNNYDFVLVRTGEGKAYGLWEFYPEKASERDRVRAKMVPPETFEKMKKAKPPEEPEETENPKK